ncbi:Thiolase, C-terminal domain [Popillia japonica]|uniref:Thiolase, C-terminal domain n=1 Tax=Popillia japonica TaxID=7064 RepID=A0AAW1KSK6_POPJA
MENQVYIVSGCRTGIGSFLGQYSNISSVTLGATVIEEALKRANIKTDEIDQVIMGQVLTNGVGQNPARQAMLKVGIPLDVPAFTLNMVCGSGLKSVYEGHNAIKAGEAKIIVSGGMENMTMAKHIVSGRVGTKLGNLTLEDTILADGLTDPMIKLHMGDTAEYLAKTYNVSREEQDNFALESQTRARNATANNHFKPEIIGVKNPKGGLIETDEYIRASTTIEDLKKLPPRFQTDGSVTAANASGINDSAAAVVICSGDVVRAKNLIPLARIVAFAESGCEPIEMGLGPIKSVRKVVEKAGWKMDEVDLFELNEAFAVQSIIVVKSLGIDMSKVNVSGGALSLGHPIGASGTRILVTLIYNMIRLGKTKGVASLCIGGGMGIAIAIQRD